MRIDNSRTFTMNKHHCEAIKSHAKKHTKKYSIYHSLIKRRFMTLFFSVVYIRVTSRNSRTSGMCENVTKHMSYHRFNTHYFACDSRNIFSLHLAPVQHLPWWFYRRAIRCRSNKTSFGMWILSPSDDRLTQSV